MFHNSRKVAKTTIKGVDYVKLIVYFCRYEKYIHPRT